VCVCVRARVCIQACVIACRAALIPAGRGEERMTKMLGFFSSIITSKV